MRKSLLKLLIKFIAPSKRVDKVFIKATLRKDDLLGMVDLEEWSHGIKITCWYPVLKHHDFFDYKKDLGTAWSDFLLLREFIKEVPDGL
jgi:hypothetical protein